MLQITGKHIEVTDAIREHCEEQFQKIEEHSDLSHKSISFGKNRHLYEVVAKAQTNHGVEANATGTDTDCYKAINLACKRLKKQIDKDNSKRVSKKHETLNDLIDDEEEPALSA